MGNETLEEFLEAVRAGRDDYAERFHLDLGAICRDLKEDRSERELSSLQPGPIILGADVRPFVDPDPNSAPAASRTS